jgi:hypothetical protein
LRNNGMQRYPHWTSAEPSPPLGPAEVAQRPPLASSSDPANLDRDAFAEWLAHVDAGRIEVR